MKTDLCQLMKAAPGPLTRVMPLESLFAARAVCCSLYRAFQPAFISWSLDWHSPWSYVVRKYIADSSIDLFKSVVDAAVIKRLSPQSISHMFDAAVLNNQTECARYILGLAACEVSHSTTSKLVEKVTAEMLSVLVHIPGFTTRALTLSALTRSYGCLNFLLENVPRALLPEQTLELAATSGSLVCVRRAHELGFSFNEMNCLALVTNCGLDCLEYARANGARFTHPLSCELAARDGNLDSLRFLREFGTPWNANTTDNAAAKGELLCLAYAIENGCDMSEIIYHRASASRSIACMKYLFDNTGFWPSMDTDMCSGNIECTIFLRQRGCAWSPRCMELAIVRNDVEYLKFLHDNGAPWCEDPCTLAAGSGSYECLRLLHHLEKPWGRQTTHSAETRNQTKCLAFALSHGCPWDGDACEFASKIGDGDLLKILHERGLPWNEKVCSNSAAIGHIDILQYAHESGCPWDAQTMLMAAWADDVPCLKYAYENGCPHPLFIVEQAIYSRARKCLNYLLSLDFSPKTEYSMKRACMLLGTGYRPLPRDSLPTFLFTEVDAIAHYRSIL